MSKYIYLRPEQSETGRYSLYNANGEDVYSDLGVHHGLMAKAMDNEQAIRFNTETGRARRVDMKMFFEKTQSHPINEQKQAVDEDIKEHEDITNFIQHEAVGLKPSDLFIEPLVWKYLVRNVVRSQNTVMCGPTGSGKTQTVYALARALNRPLHTFNLGATQDARGSLIGNTHFKNEETLFNESPFVKAIQTPNAIILLDELSRANPEASNILMSVLDDKQRFLRLDEEEDSPIIKVHPTVTFLATANIGTEYTATRVMDRALMDRFVPITMEYLSEDEEFQLLTKLFPEVSDHNRKMVAKAVTVVREDVKEEDGQLTHNLSTRHSIEMASLINDGFSVKETLDLVVWPQYDTDGGMESDQSYVKKLVQSVITEEPEPIENKYDESEPEIPEF